jgi:hypothetical protein
LESQVFVLDEKGHFYYEGIVPDVEMGDYSIRLVSPRLTRILTYRVEEGNPTTERITCNFPDNSVETYSCNYVINEQMSELCRGSLRCSGLLEDYELGDEFEWYSSGLTTDDSPTYFDGTNKEIAFTKEPSGSPEIEYKENVTCIFDDGSGDDVISPLYSCSGYQDGQNSEIFTCSGYDRCVVEIKGAEQVTYVWTSTVPDTKEKVNLLNNEDDVLTFISPEYIEATWNCNDGFYVDSATSSVALTKAVWLNDYIKPSCDDHEGIASYDLVEDETEISFAGKAFASLFGTEEITETFTCIFEGSDTEETCYSSEGKCSGVGKCNFTISAEEETIVSVRSSIVGSEPYSVLVDGVDKIGIFSVPAESISEEITCIFTQSQPVEQMCYSSKGECVGIDICNVTIEGEEGEYVIWKSTVEGSADVETKILGSPKVLEFFEVIEEAQEESVEEETTEVTETRTTTEIGVVEEIIDEESSSSSSEEIGASDEQQSGSQEVENDPEICNDGFDNDGDGLVDCADNQ